MKGIKIMMRRYLAHHPYDPGLLILIVLLCHSFQPVRGQEDRYKGQRPYELDWAGRYEDDHVPLIDFEKSETWTVDVNKGSASINRSNEEMIWDDYTYKLSYQANSTDASFLIHPPGPVNIPEAFTAVNLWVCGNYRIWNDNERKRPVARLNILLGTREGKTFEIPFSRNLDFGRWYLLHIRLNENQRQAFADGGTFNGFRLTNCLPGKKMAIFFDNLSFYAEDLSTPLPYDTLPRPGIDLAPGQDLGVHSGKERLPFPTREETILPDNITSNFATNVYREGSTFILRYSGDDGELEYRYKPAKGDLSDFPLLLLPVPSTVHS